MKLRGRITRVLELVYRFSRYVHVGFNSISRDNYLQLASPFGRRDKHRGIRANLWNASRLQDRVIRYQERKEEKGNGHFSLLLIVRKRITCSVRNT